MGITAPDAIKEDRQSNRIIRKVAGAKSAFNFLPAKRQQNIVQRNGCIQLPLKRPLHPIIERLCLIRQQRQFHKPYMADVRPFNRQIFCGFFHIHNFYVPPYGYDKFFDRILSNLLPELYLRQSN